MMLSIWDSINGFADSFKDWMIKNGSNPLLWIGLFFIGLLLFAITYKALQKEK